MNWNKKLFFATLIASLLAIVPAAFAAIKNISATGPQSPIMVGVAIVIGLMGPAIVEMLVLRKKEKKLKATKEEKKTLKKLRKGRKIFGGISGVCAAILFVTTFTGIDLGGIGYWAMAPVVVYAVMLFATVSMNKREEKFATADEKIAGEAYAQGSTGEQRQLRAIGDLRNDLKTFAEDVKKREQKKPKEVSNLVIETTRSAVIADRVSEKIFMAIEALDQAREATKTKKGFTEGMEQRHLWHGILGLHTGVLKEINVFLEVEEEAEKLEKEAEKDESTKVEAKALEEITERDTTDLGKLKSIVEGMGTHWKKEWKKHKKSVGKVVKKTGTAGKDEEKVKGNVEKKLKNEIETAEKTEGGVATKLEKAKQIMASGEKTAEQEIKEIAKKEKEVATAENLPPMPDDMLPPPPPED